MSEATEQVYDTAKILAALPHRYPMLLVDRVVSLGEEEIHAVKAVSFNEGFFQGHFPGRPIMPGVLQIEALAQAAGILAIESLGLAGTGKLVYFMAIEEAKFRNPVTPGNLLDLYAVSDIPETESYGMTPLPIPGFRGAPDDVNPDPDPSQNLIARFASSAAHVAGKPLASSETLTWLRENFREAPWAAKPQLDRLFAAGINHIFYHGTCYSPDEAAWPGWVFYASTQMNPRNSIWRDAPVLNDYAARCQSVLQSGQPDNDLLVYWPIHDLWHSPTGLARNLTVHARDCRVAFSMDAERQVEVEWEEGSDVARKVRIRVDSRDEPGLLAKITKTISSAGVNIGAARIVTHTDRTATQSFDLWVNDAKTLQAVMKEIGRIKGVHRVERMRS